MQKTDLTRLSIACVMACLPFFGTAVMAQDSVQTVEALLKAENQAVAAKLAAAEMASKPVQPVVVAKAKPGPASIVVTGIYGVHPALSADIVYNGMTYTKVAVGAMVGPCILSSINGKSVMLNSKLGSRVASADGLSKNEVLVSKPSKKEMEASAKAKLQCHPAEWTEPSGVMASLPSNGPVGLFPRGGGMYPVPSLISKPATVSATQASTHTLAPYRAPSGSIEQAK